MEKLNLYKNYFELIDERTPFSLFKKYVFELIEIAEEQQHEIEKQQELRKDVEQTSSRPPIENRPKGTFKNG